MKDDGLSEFGREMVGNPTLTELTRKLKTLGVDMPSSQENIFDLEAGDKRIENSWKKKVAAEQEWQALLGK